MRLYACLTHIGLYGEPYIIVTPKGFSFRIASYKVRRIYRLDILYIVPEIWIILSKIQDSDRDRRHVKFHKM